MNIDEFLVDPAPGSKAVDRHIRRVLQDDTSLRIEDLNEHEKRRLTLGFIGWTHQPWNSNRVASHIKKLHLLQLLEESPSTIVDRQYDVASYYVVNMLVRGLEVRRRITKNETEHEIPLSTQIINDTILNPHGKPDAFAYLNFCFKGESNIPVFKPTDLTVDLTDHSTLRFLKHEPKLNTVICNKPDWVTTSPISTRKRIERYLARECEYTAARERQMRLDLSIAAANELRRSKGQVRIGILSGGFHAPALEKPFRTMGFNTYLHRFDYNGRPIKDIASDTPIYNMFVIPEMVARRQMIDFGSIHKETMEDMLFYQLFVECTLGKEIQKRFISPPAKGSVLPAGVAVVHALSREQRDTVWKLWSSFCNAYRKDPSTNCWGKLIGYIETLMLAKITNP